MYCVFSATSIFPKFRGERWHIYGIFRIRVARIQCEWYGYRAGITRDKDRAGDKESKVGSEGEISGKGNCKCEGGVLK